MESEWPNIFELFSIESEESDNVSEDIFDKTELTLCNHNLRQLPNRFFENFNNIVKLNLSDNNIRELPESISLFKKLEQFIVDRNNIEQLPHEITHLEILNEFSISENCLSTLPTNMEKLNKLQILNLSGNKLNCLPKSWVKMNNLITLDISKNLFKKVPDCLREGMLGIQSLNVSGNQKMNINGEIFSRNLRKFYAKYNGAIDTSFPKWILSGRCSEIYELEFEGTQFKSFNVPISERKISLKKLNLKNCRLYDTVLDKILGNLSSVEYLDIGNAITISTGNSFSILPSGAIHNPQKSIAMCIHNTGLTDVSKSIELFANLTRIDLHGNYLSWLPDEICNLKKLQVLDISSNMVVMLPQNLGSMASLKILKAANNNISSLPPSITDLQNLEWIDLFGNDFTEMPEEIEVLINLQALDLESNYFATDDTELSLNYLDLRNQLRTNESHRSIGPRVIDSDSEIMSSPESKYDEWNSSNDGKSIQEDANEVIEEENWDKTEDFADEFDPFNPPPITPPKWETPHVFFANLFDFCPADLHAQRIKDVIARARADGQCPSLLPIVEGQFDDIEQDLSELN